MDKLKMESANLTQKNIDKIAELFPNVLTEMRDESGQIKRGINFDLLKQELAEDLADGQESYDFTWVGKNASILESNTPIRKTLRPCIPESKNWETTGNLYIEGDNLDVLKLLQESYLGQVKMIYIDPPYNTGNDFIYRDNFAIDQDEYEEQIGMFDEEENRLFRNIETNGRFHSDWCSMLYPRLRIAEKLLREDGVIFLSIDDNEVENLRKICNEVFGEKNFVAQILWKKRSTPPNDKVIGANHDYISIYAKNIEMIALNLRPRSDEQIARYKNPDNHPKGPWTAGDLMANVKGGRYVPSLYYPITNPNTSESHYPGKNGNWRFNKEKVERLQANNEIYFGEDGKGRPKLKRFYKDIKTGITWPTIWDFVPLNTSGSSEMQEILGDLTVFENPKPVGLITELLRVGSDTENIILDFFSGSGSTAHAVMQLNAEDGGNRKFIMAQLSEETDEQSAAYQAGYKNICEIGKERIRRAGEKIKVEIKKKNIQLKLGEDPLKVPDIGFRVLKVDSTNMKEVFYAANQYNQDMLAGLESNIKEDRSDLDLLYGVMLDWGLQLSLSHKMEEISGVTVHIVDEGSLVACFAERVSEEVVRAIAKKQPLRVVFRDGSFKNSADKINIEEIFKLLAPNTTVKVL